MNTTLFYLTNQTKKFALYNCHTYGCTCKLHFTAMTFLAHVPKVQATLDTWLEKALNFQISETLDFFDEASETSTGTYRNFVSEYTNLISMTYEAMACHDETLNRFTNPEQINPLKLPITAVSVSRLNSVTAAAAEAIHTRWPGTIRYLEPKIEVFNANETLQVTINHSNFAREVKLIKFDPNK